MAMNHAYVTRDSVCIGECDYDSVRKDICCQNTVLGRLEEHSKILVFHFKTRNHCLCFLISASDAWRSSMLVSIMASRYSVKFSLV